MRSTGTKVRDESRERWHRPSRGLPIDRLAQAIREVGAPGRFVQWPNYPSVFIGGNDLQPDLAEFDGSSSSSFLVGAGSG